MSWCECENCGGKHPPGQFEVCIENLQDDLKNVIKDIDYMLEEAGDTGEDVIWIKDQLKSQKKQLEKMFNK